MSGNEEIERTKADLEQAFQAYVKAQYGPDHWLGDYLMTAVVLDMSETGSPDTVHYFHDSRGPAHSLRGLCAEQEEWLIDMRLEEKEAVDDADD